MENITLLGIDLAKRYSHFVCQNHTGSIIFRKKVATLNLVEEVCKLSGKFEIAMEACGSSNHWGRMLKAKGYVVKLIPPQYVKAFRTKQKNDYNDAQATCEASKRKDIHPVPVKDLDRQTAQHIIRSRQRLLKDRVELVNHLHGILTEYGYCAPKGYLKLIKYVREELFAKELLNRESFKLISEDLEELESKQLRIDKITKEIKQIVKKDPELSRMLSIPGVGEITALSIYGQVQDLERFKNGRQFAAFLGLVPRQYSTGGETKLGGVPKNGKYPIRSLLAHGARAISRLAKKRSDNMSLWVGELKKRMHNNMATIALANKLARIIWGVMTSKNKFIDGYINPNFTLNS